MYKTILLALLYFIYSSPTFSAEESLRAAVFNIPPWGSETKSGKVIGIQKDIIDIIAKDTKIPIQISLIPYKRMIKFLKEGDSDFGIFYINKDYDSFATPLVRWGELSIIVLPLKNIKIKKYEDLNKLSVGVRLGGKFNDKFDNDKNIFKKSCVNYSDCIESLKKGRIDGVIGTAATLYYELEKQGLKDSYFGDPFVVGTKEDWLHFSNKSKNKKLRAKLIKSVEKNIQNGNFEKAFSKYLPKKWQHK
jgi:polar amino acid transport system substrate-binding protein